MYPYKNIHAQLDALARSVFFTKQDPTTRPAWPDFLELVNHSNEISKLFYWKEDGEYLYETATQEYEQKLEERLMRKHRRTLQVVELQIHHGWSLDDYEQLYSLRESCSLPKMFQLAARIIVAIKKGDKPVVLHSAAICHEDAVIKKVNLSQFSASTFLIGKSDVVIFDQLPFVEIFDEWLIRKKVGWHELFDEFFCRLIESSLIDTVFAGANAEHSKGARREIRTAEQCGLPVLFLPPDFHSYSVDQAKELIGTLVQ